MKRLNYTISLTNPNTLKKYQKADLFEIGVSNDPKIGIYFLWNKDELVYIGKTTNILFRINSHNSKSKNKKNYEFTHFSFIITDNPFIINIAEPLYIDKFKPKYNVNFKEDRDTETYIYL
jgi:excinuclease UvrABC nuclease subunit